MMVTSSIRHISNTAGKSKSSVFLSFACACLFSLPIVSPLSAQGVAAGTDISNKVIVNYQVDNIAQEPIESSPSGNSLAGTGNGQATTFKVDRKIDLVLTGNSNANVNPGDSQAEVTFTLQNEGNAIQEFSLIPDYTLTSDDFDSNNCHVEVTGVTGALLPSVTLPTSGNIKLKADQQASISVKCDIPLNHNSSPINTGDTSLLSLIATTEKNEDGSITTESSADTPSGIETVYADNAGLDDSVRDAMHSARRTYTASNSTIAPTLAMEKTIVSVLDSSSGNTAIAGAEVTYNIRINTTGMGVINNLVITDPTPAEMSYKTGSIKLNNSNQSDANDITDNTDFGVTTANTATINLGNIAAGSQYDIQLTYIIN
jgi:uncharacterized repeat protein (TIGR01451 family)